MSNGKENQKGILFALGSYMIWGVMPVYWQALEPIDSSVVIYYRIILVAAVSFLVSWKMYGWETIKTTMKTGPKAAFFFAGIFITINWSLYVWAVKAHFVIQTSIGHYIEPLMIAVFGVILFKEKLTGLKLAAFIFAGVGILLMILHYRETPFLAVSLGATFAVYAAIKKKYIVCPSMLSLFYETVFFVPLAAAAVIYLETTGRGALRAAAPPKYLLLMTVGFVTAAVLWLFSESGTKTTLSNIGLIAYISPTISLLLGIFVLDEPFDTVQLASFLIIWIGLAIFAFGSWRYARKAI